MQPSSGEVGIKIADSYMGGYLARPEGGVLGGIVVLQEIFGVTPAMRAIADDFASQGYVALVPDIYWRLERNLNLGNGEDAEQRQLAVDYSNRLDEIQCIHDIVAGLDWLASNASLSVAPAVLGFCLGGRLAVRAAASSKPACMVSMYGVKLDTLADEIKAIRCPMQFHFGENDNHNPLEKIEAIARVVAEKGNPNDEFFRYPAVEHAFYNRFRTDRFNESAHRLAKKRVLEFLRVHLVAGKRP